VLSTRVAWAIRLILIWFGLEPGRKLALPVGSLFWQYLFMATSNKVILKKRVGRPATGNDPVRAIRLSDAFLAKVDLWAAKQDDEPGRSEAIRRLVEFGLKAKK